MNEQIKALKMAIEAMEATMSTHGFKENIYDAKEKAIQACKEALEQPAHLTVPQQIEKALDGAVGVVKPDMTVHWSKKVYAGDLLFKYNKQILQGLSIKEKFDLVMNDNDVLAMVICELNMRNKD